MTDGDLPTATDLPDAMTERTQWLCWRSKERGGKQTKIPVEPGTDAYASATDPDTWRGFDTARNAATEAGLGLGFVFTSGDPLVGVDLDDCRDPETGALDDDAQAIVSQLDSFTEVSPSETGVHVIVEGALPGGRNRHGTVEMYEDARFFTVTGDRLSDTPTRVEQRSDALAAVHGEYVAVETPTDITGSAPPSDSSQATLGKPRNDLTDSDLLERARGAANGEKFARLYDGSTAGYPSQSEADMALCSLLAFWTGGDSAQMDRLFRGSGLYRGKWDEVHFSDGATYGERTIERAIAGTSEFYESGGGEPWTAFDHREGATAHRPDAAQAIRASSTTAVQSTALETLREKLDELEETNEQLQDQLNTERAHRRRAEAQLAEVTTPGILERLFGW